MNPRFVHLERHGQAPWLVNPEAIDGMRQRVGDDGRPSTLIWLRGQETPLVTERTVDDILAQAFSHHQIGGDHVSR